jgi:hypothetical protein
VESAKKHQLAKVRPYSESSLRADYEKNISFYKAAAGEETLSV